jgi:AcrR family transcriptional regulator
MESGFPRFPYTMCMAHAAPRWTPPPNAPAHLADARALDRGRHVLARHLKVTRGSFYWHFKDREDLLRAVLQAWRARHRAADAPPGVVPRRPARAAARPDLAAVPRPQRGACGAHRTRDPRLGAARRDGARLRRRGRRGAHRLHRAGVLVAGLRHRRGAFARLLLYSYEVAESLLSPQGGESQRQERAAFVERLLQQPLSPLP